MKSRRRARWLLLPVVLLVLLVLGVWLAPAGALQAWLSMQQHPLQIQQTSGRLLHGAAAQARWQGLNLGQLDWRVLGVEPLAGRIETRFGLEGRNNSLQGETWLGMDGAVQARDIRGQLPATWIDLTSVLPLVFPVGMLHFDLQRLDHAPGRLPLADGTIRWRDAGLTGLARARFGDIDLHLGSEDGGLLARLESQPPAADKPQPDILVDGTLESDGVDYRTSLRLRVADDRDDLRRLLQAVAQPAADGSLRLEFAGKLFPATPQSGRTP